VSNALNSLLEQPQCGSHKCSVRLLCLGNELLGDDALGSKVAAQFRRFALPDLDIVCTPETGLQLLDHVVNVNRLIVVDTVVTGSAPLGTIYELRDTAVPRVPGPSPHYVGLLETLAVARELRLPAAKQVCILAVEARGCLTIGQDMHPAIVAAIPDLIQMLRQRIGTKMVEFASCGEETTAIPIRNSP